MLSPIARRSFAEPDRSAAQEKAIADVTADPERFLRAYAEHKDSFGGRYVSADLFKEMLPVYSAAREARGRYNAPVHNAAAVLSAEQFNRTLAGAQPEGIFLTGVPGSGKTTAALQGGEIGTNLRFVFEGQLHRPEPGMAKIEAALNAGVAVQIVAVLARPEDALANTFTRFGEIGRGSSIDLMADMAGELPAGLTAIKSRFGDDVALQILDVRDRVRVIPYDGWQALDILREEGNRDDIAKRLHNAVDDARRGGRIDLDTAAQALGQAPFAGYRGVDTERQQGLRTDGGGPGISPLDSTSSIVSAEAGSIVAAVEAGGREVDALDSAPAEQRWSAALDEVVASKEAQAAMLESRLEQLVDAQEVKINAAMAARPGIFALPGQRAAANRAVAEAQAVGAVLTARLERVKDVRQETYVEHPKSIHSLATARLERDEPALAAEAAAERAARLKRANEADPLTRSAADDEGRKQGRGQSLGLRR